MPAGGRTTACVLGPNDFEYRPVGGLSWTTPYLAGSAALAIQVDPEIMSDDIVRLLVSTSQHTGDGPTVNPPAFIEAVRSLR